MKRASSVIAGIFILLLIGLGGGAVYYHGEYQTADKRADAAELLAIQRQQTINDMQVRQRDVAALDARYTGELADAKTTIDQLKSDIAAGRQRLRVSATCPKRAAGAGSVGNVAGPGLTESAQRNYFTLRERIGIITAQVNYLQQYIREQCLR